MLFLKNRHRNLDNKLAIQGYDPVSYIEQNKAVKGKRICGKRKRSNLLHFVCQKQRTLEKFPTKYEPAYGGWCAFAMGDYGEKVEINPNTLK